MTTTTDGMAEPVMPPWVRRRPAVSPLVPLVAVMVVVAILWTTALATRMPTPADALALLVVPASLCPYVRAALRRAGFAPLVPRRPRLTERGIAVLRHPIDDETLPATAFPVLLFGAMFAVATTDNRLADTGVLRIFYSAQVAAIFAVVFLVWHVAWTIHAEVWRFELVLGPEWLIYRRGPRSLRVRWEDIRECEYHPVVAGPPGRNGWFGRFLRRPGVVLRVPPAAVRADAPGGEAVEFTIDVGDLGVDPDTLGGVVEALSARSELRPLLADARGLELFRAPPAARRRSLSVGQTWHGDRSPKPPAATA